MNNKESKYIDSIDIKGLWNRFDVHWQLKADVNILVGENGTGKSTILRSVMDVFESLNNFSKGLKAVENNKISLLEFSYKYNEDDVAFRCSNTGSNGSAVVVSIPDKLSYSSRHIAQDNEKQKGELIYKTYKPDFISTFDVPNKQTSNQELVLTNLNVELDILEKEFITYRFKKLRNSNKEHDPLKGETYFYETVNRLFEATGKQLNKNDEKLSFITFDNNTLHWSELSSGEKQFLIILMTVLCQDEKPSVLIMDEPEISLHLRWQYELIDIIRTLNPNCQLIMATHSPSIFGKGWRDKVVFIKDIIPQMQQQLV